MICSVKAKAAHHNQQQKPHNERGAGCKRKATEEVIQRVLVLHVKRLSQQATAKSVANEFESSISRTTVNCRGYIPSFKSKKQRRNPPEKWLRIENTHEPIIDRKTWEIVQRLRSGKRRPNKMGEMDKLFRKAFEEIAQNAKCRPIHGDCGQVYCH